MPPKVPPTSVPGRTPPLPPKIPFGGGAQRPPQPPTTQSAVDATTATSNASPSRYHASRSNSVMSHASDSSRHSLRREVQRRKNSLTTSEWEFLQHVAEVGTEVEVCLVQQKLKDPSLCFDLNEGEVEEEENVENMENVNHNSNSNNSNTNNKSDIAKPASTGDKEDTADAPMMVVDVKQAAFARDISEYTIESLVPGGGGSDDKNLERREREMDTSMGTASCVSSVGGQIPSTPVPTSPRRNARDRIPDFETLYPEQAASTRSLMADYNNKQMIDWAQLQETPVVHNLRRPSALPLDGAEGPPLPVPVRPASPQSQGPSSGRSLGSERRQSLLEEQRKADSIGPLWRAHENGLAVTPLSSRRSYQLRREVSAGSNHHHSSPGTAAIRMQYARTRNLSMDSGNDGSCSSLLSTRELQKVKLRHSRSQTEWWHKSRAMARQSHTSHESPNIWMMPPQINNKQAILRRMMEDDYDSILLPTDDEIFRRSQQQQQQFQTPHPSRGENPRVIPEPPAPPMPNHKATAVAGTEHGAAPSALRRMVSDGAAVAPPQPQIMMRRPSQSALRRLKSDCSRKSVSFALEEEQPPEEPSRLPSALLIPNHSNDNSNSRSPSWAARINPNTRRLSQSSFGELPRGSYDVEMDDSLSTFASMDYFSQQQPQVMASSVRPNPFTIANRQDSIGDNSVASLNLHMAHPIRRDSIASTATGLEATEALRQQFAAEHGVIQEDCNMAPKQHPVLFGRRDSTGSVASLNLHMAHPIRRDSVASTATGLEATEELRKQFAAEHGVLQEDTDDQDIMVPKQHPVTLGRRDSTASIASLNLHMAHPIRRDSVASTATGLEATEELRKQFAAEHGVLEEDTDDQDIMVPKQHPVTLGRRDSTASVASLNLHLAHPIRRDSVASTATGLEATEELRKQFAAEHHCILQDDTGPAQDIMVPKQHPVTLGRRDSTASVASLNLHKAHPIRRDSVASTATGLEATEELRNQFAAENGDIQDDSGDHTEDGHVPPLPFIRPRDSTGGSSIASLNLHLAKSVRSESISTTASGLEASEAFRRQFMVEGSVVQEEDPTIDEAASEAPSLNLHRAHLLREESLRSTTSYPSLHHGHPLRASSASLSSFPSLHHAHPLRQESIVSTCDGEEAKEAMKRAFASEDRPPIPDKALLDMESSMMSLGSVASMNIHPAKPVRSESISSTAAGRGATDYFRKQFLTDKNALVTWEGAVLPEEWEDKKTDTEDESSFQHHVNEMVRKHHSVGSGTCSIASKEAAQPNPNLPRPVIMRYASQSEYDEEGMEVAPAEPEAKTMPMPHDRFWKQEQYRMSHVSSSAADRPAIVMRRTSQGGGEGVELAELDGPSNDLDMRRDAVVVYNHYPSLTSFGSTATRSVASRSAASIFLPPAIESSASFDETKSVDRFRGVFRGSIPQSLSEDELSALLASHCKPKLARGQSDGTVFPSEMDSESWELNTTDGDFDAWDAIKDDYINGYGGGGTLPFQILGTGARDVDAQPHVLSPPLMESLQAFFPVPKSSDNFWMKYSLVRDGASLYTMLQHARGSKYSILALETVDGEVFGAFTAAPWRKTWSYFGGAESFLWRMRKSRKTKCTSIIDQAQMESEIDVYPFTGENHCIQLCTHDKLAIGGGQPAHHNEEKRDDSDDHNDLDRRNQIKDFEWGHGLALQGDLLSGSTSPCVTFGSPSLSDTHRDGSLFEIINLELWTLTPCFNLADAEKLELGKLFLEQSSFHADNYNG